MIFIVHYLALHVSDYHQSIISLAVARMYIHTTARLVCMMHLYVRAVRRV